MKVPHADHLLVDREKVTQYLLSPTHPDGSAKANFFSRFGFRLEEWQGFAEALRKQGASYPVVKTVESSYGTRYAVDGPVESPDTRNPMARTVWLLERGSTTPRLITAYPLEEGS